MLKTKAKISIAAAATALYGLLGTATAQAQNRVVTEQMILDYGRCWGGLDRAPNGERKYECPPEFYRGYVPYADDHVICTADFFNTQANRYVYLCHENQASPPTYVPLNPWRRYDDRQPRNHRFRYGG